MYLALCVMSVIADLEGEVFPPLVKRRGGTIFIGLLCKSTRGLLCSDFMRKGEVWVPLTAC